MNRNKVFLGVLRPQAVFPRQDQPPIPQKILGCTASYSVLMSKISQGKNSATTRVFQVEGNNSRKPLKWQCRMIATPRRKWPLFNNQQASVMFFCEGDIGERKRKEKVEGKKRKRKKRRSRRVLFLFFTTVRQMPFFPDARMLQKLDGCVAGSIQAKLKIRKASRKRKTRPLRRVVNLCLKTCFIWCFMFQKELVDWELAICSEEVKREKQEEKEKALELICNTQVDLAWASKWFESVDPWLLTTEISVRSITINNTQAAIQGNPPLPRLATKLQTEFPSFHLLCYAVLILLQGWTMCWILNRGPSQEFPKNQRKGFVWSRCKPNRKVPRLQTRRNFERRERGKWNRSRWRPKTWKKPFFSMDVWWKKTQFPICKDFGIIPLKQQFEKSRCCKFKGLQVRDACSCAASCRRKSKKPEIIWWWEVQFDTMIFGTRNFHELKGLFQPNDSKSLHDKLVFHQTSIKGLLFRVPCKNRICQGARGF